MTKDQNDRESYYALQESLKYIWIPTNLTSLLARLGVVCLKLKTEALHYDQSNNAMHQHYRQLNSTVTTSVAIQNTLC